MIHCTSKQYCITMKDCSILFHNYIKVFNLPFKEELPLNVLQALLDVTTGTSGTVDFSSG